MVDMMSCAPLALAVLLAAAQDPVAPAPAEPPPPLRVLLIESAPRYDYRYVRNLFLTDTQPVHLQALLLSAGDDFEQEHTAEVPPLRALPREHVDLFANDVILLGDVAPDQLGASDGERKAFQRDLYAFVYRGGGLCVLAGSASMPGRYADQPLGKWLPAQHDPTVELPAEAAFRVVPPDPARLHPLLAAVEDAEESVRRWSRAPVLSPVPLAPREGASTLLRARDGAGRELPLLVTASSGAGRIAMLGIEDTWRLRALDGGELHAAFWRGMVRWLAPRPIGSNPPHDAGRTAPTDATGEPTSPQPFAPKGR
jgi:hypothetical protein